MSLRLAIMTIKSSELMLENICVILQDLDDERCYRIANHLIQLSNYPTATLKTNDQDINWELVSIQNLAKLIKGDSGLIKLNEIKLATINLKDVHVYLLGGLVEFDFPLNQIPSPDRPRLVAELRDFVMKISDEFGIGRFTAGNEPGDFHPFVIFNQDEIGPAIIAESGLVPFDE